MLLIRQRRKWTRNLSLLCKEEGEELEVFLSREFKRREGQEAEKHQNAAQKKRQQMHHQKGGSLRSRALSEEDEEQEAEESGQKNTGSDGKLLERMRCRIKESNESKEFNEETNLDENVQIKVKIIQFPKSYLLFRYRKRTKKPWKMLRIQNQHAQPDYCQPHKKKNLKKNKEMWMLKLASTSHNHENRMVFCAQCLVV